MYCDGKKAEPDKFGGCLMKIALPEGSSTIELKYRTPGLIAGAVMSLAGMAILAALIIMRRCGAGMPRKVETDAKGDFGEQAEGRELVSKD